MTILPHPSINVRQYSNMGFLWTVEDIFKVLPPKCILKKISPAVFNQLLHFLGVGSKAVFNGLQ